MRFLEWIGFMFHNLSLREITSEAWSCLQPPTAFIFSKCWRLQLHSNTDTSKIQRNMLLHCSGRWRTEGANLSCLRVHHPCIRFLVLDSLCKFPEWLMPVQRHPNKTSSPDPDKMKVAEKHVKPCPRESSLVFTLWHCRQWTPRYLPSNWSKKKSKSQQGKGKNCLSLNMMLSLLLVCPSHNTQHHQTWLL